MNGFYANVNDSVKVIVLPLILPEWKWIEINGIRVFPGPSCTRMRVYTRVRAYARLVRIEWK